MSRLTHASMENGRKNYDDDDTSQKQNHDFWFLRRANNYLHVVETDVIIIDSYDWLKLQKFPIFEGRIAKLSAVPHASLIAAIIGVISISVFAGTMYKALNIFTIYIFEDLFHYRLNWLETIQDVVLVIAIAMALYVIFLLLFGVLATGATRNRVYAGMSCIMGGQTSAIFLMVITYICNIVWIIIISVCVIPLLIFIMVTSICNQHVFNKNANDVKFCMDLNNFGMFGNTSYKTTGDLTPSVLCSPTNLRRMCNRIEESGQLFIVAYIGAFFASLAMAHFMVILAANYTRMKLSKELTDYRNAVEMT